MRWSTSSWGARQTSLIDEVDKKIRDLVTFVGTHPDSIFPNLNEDIERLKRIKDEVSPVAALARPGTWMATEQWVNALKSLDFSKLPQRDYAIAANPTPEVLKQYNTMKFQEDPEAQQKVAVQMHEQTRTAAEQYADALTKLDFLHAQGSISEDTYQRNLGDLKNKFDANTIAMKSFGEAAGAAFDKFAEGGFKVKQLQSLLDALIMGAAKALIQMALLNMKNSGADKAGGATGFLYSLASGFGHRASGRARSMPALPTWLAKTARSHLSLRAPATSCPSVHLRHPAALPRTLSIFRIPRTRPTMRCACIARSRPSTARPCAAASPAPRSGPSAAPKARRKFTTENTEKHRFSGWPIQARCWLEVG